MRHPLALEPSQRPEAGGYASFVGRVRAHNEGRAVVGLAYEAYDELAMAEGARIVEEARCRFDVLTIRCDHRVGELAIGDAAIVVEVAAAHRREAFRACEFVVDEVKKRVPIWKRERYEDGRSDWINAGTARPVAGLTESGYYERQQRLPEIGVEGQRRLGDARVLVVGAGGLGCPAIEFLARAGVGTVGVADGDSLDVTNLHRQSLFRSRDTGRPKVDLVAEAVAEANPYVRVEPHPLRVSAGNADALVEGYDLVLDGTDNFETKYLLNDRCVSLGKTLVQAGVYRYEGWAMRVEPGHPGGCLRCLWPDPPAGVRSCADVGVLGVVPGLFGVLMATEAVKALLGLGDSLADRFWILDMLSMEARSIRRTARPGCPACSRAASSPPGRAAFEPIEVTPGDPLLDGGPWILLDLRASEQGSDRPASQWPWASAVPEFADLRPEVRYLAVCAHGVTSLEWTRRARASGHLNVWSLRNGATGLDRIGR
ncbi:MAG: ThiF family adenylyltransferase [Fimbriimonadaceae bacterium]|nr:ThiF family adenylyltransferase [Fimbriimonadaceae bacterium]